MQGQGRTLGYAMAVGCAVAWGLNGPLSRIVIDAGLGPTTLAGIRVTGSACVLMAGVLVANPGGLRMTPRELGLIVVFGLVGISLAQWFYFQAISQYDVGLALVIIYTAPLWVAVYERVFRQVPIGSRVAGAMLVAIGGISLAVLGGGGHGGGSTAGFVWSVLGSLAYCAQLVLASSMPGRVPATVRVGVGMVVAALFWTLIVPVWHYPWDTFDDPVKLGQLDAQLPLGVILVLIVLVGTVTPYALMVMAVMRIGPTAAGVTGMIEPMVAAILGWVMLGQSLTLIQMAGIGLALAAVVAAETARSRMPNVVSPAGAGVSP
jgi:drug/metabolite transporter (DMT)-like permease